MNSYTDSTQFIETAQHILDNSNLLIKAECMIVDNVLYERLEQHTDEDMSSLKYRFFFSTDDYDYLEDQSFIDKLDLLFAERDSR